MTLNNDPNDVTVGDTPGPAPEQSLIGKVVDAVRGAFNNVNIEAPQHFIAPEQQQQMTTTGEAAAKAAQNFYPVLGAVVGRYTAGLADVAASYAGKLYARSRYRTALENQGMKVKEAGSDYFLVTSPQGNSTLVPLKTTVDQSAIKNIGELYASVLGVDVTPKMKAEYNVTDVFGTYLSVAGGIRKLTEAISGLRAGTALATGADIAARVAKPGLNLTPRLLRIAETGMTGATANAIIQLEHNDPADFSFSNTLKEGGLWMAFGGTVEAALAASEVSPSIFNKIANAYYARQAFEQFGPEVLSTKEWSVMIAAQRAVRAGMPEAEFQAKFGETLKDPMAKVQDYLQLKNWKPRRWTASNVVESPEEIIRKTDGVVKDAAPTVSLELDTLTPEDLAWRAAKVRGETPLGTETPAERAKNPYSRWSTSMVAADAKEGIELARRELWFRYAETDPYNVESLMRSAAVYDRLAARGPKAPPAPKTTFQQAQDLHADLSKEQVADIEKIAGSLSGALRAIDLATSYHVKAAEVPATATTPEDVLNKQHVAEYNEEFFRITKAAAYAQNTMSQRIQAAMRPGGKQEAVQGGIEAGGAAGGRGRNLFPFLRSLESMEPALDGMSLQVGKPLSETYRGIVIKKNAAINDSDKYAWGALQQKGFTKYSAFMFSMRPEQNALAADWLFSGDEAGKEAVWNKMLPMTQNVAEVMQDYLQNFSGPRLRYLRWNLYNNQMVKLANDLADATKKKSPEETKVIAQQFRDKAIKLKDDLLPNAPDDVLTQGRAAQSIGQLKEWAYAQSWGTKENYFMVESEIHGLVDEYAPHNVSEKIMNEKLDTGKTVVSTDLAAVHARRAEALERMKTGSVIAAVLQHGERIAVYSEISDDLQAFSKMFDEAGPTFKDRVLMTKVLRNVVGRYEPPDDWVAGARAISRFFWRSMFLQPTYVNLTIMRQLSQNAAFLPSQVPITRWAGATKELLDLRKTNPEAIQPMLDKMRELWAADVSEKGVIWKQFVMQDEDEMASRAGFLGRTRAISKALADIPAQIMPLTDEASRGMAYPGCFWMAYKDAQAFQAGELPLRDLVHGLEIDNKSPIEYARMMTALEQGKPDEFAHVYASVAVRNANGRYATLYRSPQEQTAAGKLFWGLIVYPRIAIQAMINNGVKPAVVGYTTDNGEMFVNGMKVLLKYFAGMGVAYYGFKKLAGLSSEYNPFTTPLSYSIFSPGLAKLYMISQEVRRLVSDLESHPDKTGWQIAKRFVESTVDEAALYFPCSKALIDYYESVNNVQGVRAGSLLIDAFNEKNEFAKNKERFKAAERTMYQKVLHVYCGGFESPEQPVNMFKKAKK